MGPTMKTLRIRLPVLAQEDEGHLLDLVTRVPGVVAAVVVKPRLGADEPCSSSAALVDEAQAAVEVVLSRHATALLVERQVRDALWAGVAVPA